MVKVIGIIGKMGSGKTTVSEELVNQRYVFEELAFADAIVDGAIIFVKAKYIDPTKRSKEFRLIKQGIGEKMRELCDEVFGHSDVFVDYLFNRLRLDSVISDVGMLREAERGK